MAGKNERNKAWQAPVKVDIKVDFQMELLWVSIWGWLSVYFFCISPKTYGDNSPDILLWNLTSEVLAKEVAENQHIKEKVDSDAGLTENKLSFIKVF